MSEERSIYIISKDDWQFARRFLTELCRDAGLESKDYHAIRRRLLTKNTINYNGYRIEKIAAKY